MSAAAVTPPIAPVATTPSADQESAKLGFRLTLPAQILERPSGLWEGRDRRPTLREVEQAYIRFVLEQVKGSQTRAAGILGISRKALWEKRRRYGIP